MTAFVHLASWLKSLAALCKAHGFTQRGNEVLDTATCHKLDSFGLKKLLMFQSPPV